METSNINADCVRPFICDNQKINIANAEDAPSYTDDNLVGYKYNEMDSNGNSNYYTLDPALVCMLYFSLLIATINVYIFYISMYI